MADEKKPRDVRDLKGWDDELRKLKEPEAAAAGRPKSPPQQSGQKADEMMKLIAAPKPAKALAVKEKKSVFGGLFGKKKESSPPQPKIEAKKEEKAPAKPQKEEKKSGFRLFGRKEKAAEPPKTLVKAEKVPVKPQKEEKKPRDIKDMMSWGDEMKKLKEPEAAAAAGRPRTSGFDTSRVSENVESEWEARIRDAKKGEKPLISASEKTGEKFESIDQVFEKLKKDEAERPVVKAKIGEKRLEKIGGAIRGEIQEVKARELTGQEIPGLYKIYSLGGVPPFNLLSKLLHRVAQESLDRDLENAKMPLYADEYANFAVAVGSISALAIAFVILLLMQFSIVFAILAFLVSLFLVSFLVINIPSIQVKGGSSDVEKQLPFALRHMSALLSAGISIFDSMVSVSKTDYGTLSAELDKVVWDVKSGENLSDALDEASHRIGSHSFTRVTTHIRRALQMGGDVAGIISQIADDLTFEMRMKVSDFVEKLNAFAIVYIIGGIVGPVVIAVFSVVGNAGGGQQQIAAAGIDQFSMIFLLLIIFPLVMGLITFVVHAMEPKV